jgi:geranylgeranyl transferase type-2 subunit beta
MPSEPYLLRLGRKVATGAALLSEELQESLLRFLRSRQHVDGGFTGRDSESDLYYTAFALRGLAALSGLEPELCRSVAAYLRGQRQAHVSVVDLVSWLSSAVLLQLAGGEDLLAEADPAWPDRLAAALEAFRVDDGGYAKTHAGAAGSTYHSFLVVLCYELIGRQVPDANRLVNFIRNRQREDGGFVEIEPMKRSGTNPTAAAVAALMILGADGASLRESVGAFLSQVASTEGGYQANARIPFADGLSTFTGLLTLMDLQLADEATIARCERFIESLEAPGGGYRGASWDPLADVEYSYYALGTLALARAMRGAT